MTRALVFDLDDTLYAERSYALSGFAAVADHVAVRYGVERDGALQTLVRALRNRERGRAFQLLCEKWLGNADRVSELTAVYRRHTPHLRLPAASAETVRIARRSWKVGILTNGLPSLQRTKVKALGLESMVDAVVYAQETCAGKPELPAFRAICHALDVEPARSVMVGDDPWCDIDGGRRAGLRVIRVRRGWHRHVPAGDTGPADVTVARVQQAPGEADRLIHAEQSRAD
jgi:putative hydrolase of the HAD superfamily